MKESELRIGNYVNFKSEDDDFSILLKFEFESGWNMDYIKPVSLTEKWLINFGFEEIKEDDGYDYMLEIGDLDCFAEWENGKLVGLRVDGVNYILHFVHELQNLYFALKGEELTLSL